MSTIKKILINKDSTCQSIWFMRQAGRYLPEFRKIRSQNKNFIKLCLDSDLSSEITLQPIRRYDLDSAIVFSDILLVPYALGQEVDFIKNSGPMLSEFNKDMFFNNNKENFTIKLKPIYDSIKKTRKKLDKNKSLISFVGAPWTLLIYMLNLKLTGNKINLTFIESQKTDIKRIIDNLVIYLCKHIEKQIEAGADLVQVFDSWAGIIPNININEFCYEPNLKIVNFCRERKIPIICFPKGIGKKYLEFNTIVKPDGLNLDYDVDPVWAKKNLHEVVLQGGMNPKILLKSRNEINIEAKKYLDIFKDVPYIFNLGHGIVPETEPDKLKSLIDYVRKYK
ncbi:uroporphyrinogen decarboxylase [Candidatus Pelagibacter bacterium]|nr:uroporphyrinogen decarboxylase [Candidatus Pelagibacter bacterium]MDA9624956.1 uroporphyrinogen decarboxylase [Candidatus Pelagibacter bacterium]